MKAGAFAPLLTLHRPETIFRHRTQGAPARKTGGMNSPQDIGAVSTAIYASFGVAHPIVRSGWAKPGVSPGLSLQAHLTKDMKIGNY